MTNVYVVHLAETWALEQELTDPSLRGLDFDTALGMMAGPQLRAILPDLGMVGAYLTAWRETLVLEHAGDNDGEKLDCSWTRCSISDPSYEDAHRAWTWDLVTLEGETLARVVAQRWTVAEKSELTVVVLAQKFHQIVQDRFTREELREVDYRNKRYGLNSCATHDFTDANEIMLEAFREVKRREPNMEDETDCATWSQAWERAKRHGFNREWTS